MHGVDHGAEKFILRIYGAYNVTYENKTNPETNKAKLEYRGSFDYQLRVIYVKTLNDSDCFYIRNGIKTYSNKKLKICTIGNNNSTTFIGDSGAPLTLKGKDELIGVHTHGDNDNHQQLMFSARMEYFYDWVKKNINAERDPHIDNGKKIELSHVVSVQIQKGRESTACMDKNYWAYWWPFGKTLSEIYYSTAENHQHECSGGIIADRFILTAAHCVQSIAKTKNFKSMSVVVGESNLTKVSENQRYCVENVIIHEKFNSTNNWNDIAIIKLTRNIDLSEKKTTGKAKKLEITKEFLRSRRVGIVGGYAERVIEKPNQAARTIGSYDKQLGNMSIVVVDGEECHFNITADPQLNEDEIFICANRTDDRRTAHSDPGAPVITSDNLAFGIASYAATFYNTTKKAHEFIGNKEVFVRLEKYYDWIHDIISGH